MDGDAASLAHFGAAALAGDIGEIWQEFRHRDAPTANHDGLTFLDDSGKMGFGFGDIPFLHG